MIWHGYVEEHRLGDTDRKVGGAATRLADPPVVVMGSPDEVADWVVAAAAKAGKAVTGDAAARNALMVRSRPALRGAALRGKSAYTSVHLGEGRVVDVCAEVVATTGENMCPGSAGGHDFRKNDKGEWRCRNCSQLM